MAVRIPKLVGGDRLYLANTKTGERIEIREKHRENIEDVEQIFKYKWRPGLDTLSSMKSPKEKDGQITYMTYVDKNGNLKEARYINNGKQIDLSIEERERYLAEAREADKVLRDAIEEHEKTPTLESHLRVKDAMQKRVAVDKKYDVLEKQKEVSKDSILNSKEMVEDNDGKSFSRAHDDEDDEWGPWSRRNY